MVHRKILQDFPKAEEIDYILFNEWMNMIKGKTATAKYIINNLFESGLEVWRMLHTNHEPQNFNAIEELLRKKDRLCQARATNME